MTCVVTPIRVTLREARKAAGMTQDELAELANVRQATISQIELGTSKIDLNVLDRLSAALGIEPRDLIVRVDESKSRKKRS